MGAKILHLEKNGYKNFKKEDFTKKILKLRRAMG